MSNKLTLKAKFPSDFLTVEMLKFSSLPCICKIGKGRFLIEFIDPLPQVVGEVEEFNLSEIDQRAPAGGGGEYIHYSFALITLHSLGDDLFSIEDLSLFKRLSPGWFPIMINGDWALPFGGDEPKVREGTANAKKIGRKAARKQEILMTALKGKAE